MASTVISNAVTSASRETAARNKKKKKKIIKQRSSCCLIRDQTRLTAQNGDVSWKSETQQQVYSSKLLKALRHVRHNSAPKRGRAVREAADKALAVSAKGRTRWSRAIVTNKLKLKFFKKRRIQRGSMAETDNNRLQKKNNRVSVYRLRMKNSSTVQRKVKVLSRLVPGCRKQPFPVILEEASDYIAALEMQVRAMSALAELLSGSGSPASSSASPTNQLGSSRPPSI